CLKRIRRVRDFRLASKNPATRKLAEFPLSFHNMRLPDSAYLAIPEVSSERRAYIPIAFLPPKVMASNLLKVVEGATLYHFGVLTSNVHMAWVRAVCGRLKSDYRYSAVIVYNNFPWPKATEAQKSAIERTANAILDARSKYKGETFSALYDPLTMPEGLQRAHRDNDHAVMRLYGLPAKDIEESRIVASLMSGYLALS
ncbi:MAG: class I SAM-dependent DNA methyltransferase, partial [Deltaproteobacteria bacterium]|nr:class I SAM-dependent DNA methyltransferase [Deltaproteobacteria bacterium]